MNKPVLLIVDDDPQVLAAVRRDLRSRYRENRVISAPSGEEALAAMRELKSRGVFNHPNFALPSNQAGTPGKPATQTGFGALTSTISPPTGLLGVGLGGDSSPRMVAFQGRIEF